ncbi:DMT family transporter [Aestuariivirga litoralis]|uniref:DMT family transporter n=1 Tax=Aestuariivirga litoralis TaxID=2650924 RepID=UPI0018C58B69|nr:DMT family transporter [Aestuariivirga litoralis]
MDSPGFLLLGTGLGLGLNFPLGKLAFAAGFAAPVWAAFISLGAGLVLLVVASQSEAWPQDKLGLIRFSFLSGFLSFVMPNLITFTVIPKIGSGLTGLMFAISPMMTALLSWAFNVRPPNKLTLMAIGLGFIGAVVIVFGKDGGVGGGISPWLLLALCIPFFLAAGNLYRSLGWPKDAGPRLLGSLTNLSAVPFLLIVALLLHGTIDLAPFGQAPLLAFSQLLASSLMFMLFFRLQQVGGPTYLSQIGYVGAAVGLFAGVTFLGESYPVEVWIGAAIIAVGISLSTYASTRG